MKEGEVRGYTAAGMGTIEGTEETRNAGDGGGYGLNVREVSGAIKQLNHFSTNRREFRMKLSARNQFQGNVVRINEGQAMAEVVVNVGTLEFVAAITKGVVKSGTRCERSSHRGGEGHRGHDRKMISWKQLIFPAGVPTMTPVGNVRSWLGCARELDRNLGHL